MNILMNLNMLNMKYNIRKRLITLILSIVFIFTYQGCKEIYEPDLNHDNQYLVVDGLITNLAGPHEIKLSKTNVFSQGYEHIPVENAIIKIVDSQEGEIILEEEKPGSYITRSNFMGEINETYTLHITTEDGKTYKSNPQILLDPVEIDSFYGETSTETFYYETGSQNSINSKDVEGVNLFVDVSCDGDNIPRFRFESVLMLQYKYIPEGYVEEGIINYCWEVRDITYITGSDLIENLSATESERNRIGFLPNNKMDMKYIGFPVFKTDTTIEVSPWTGENDQIPIIYLQPRIFYNTVYTLNDDAYTFYHERYTQTSNEGRFFDPIAPQIIGNIYCEDDEDEIVLGFFEASSVSMNKTYNIRNSNSFDTLEFFEIPDCSNCNWNEVPYWWIQ